MARGAFGERSLVVPLLLPTWVVIGLFTVVPVAVMALHSFLTREFRGGVDWTFSLAAYDRFFLNCGLFGDEPPRIEWASVSVSWRSIWQAAMATVLCVLVGFPTAWFIATRSARSRGAWLFLVTVPNWVNLLIRTVSLRCFLRDTGPHNQGLMGLGLIDAPLPIANTNVAVQIGLFHSYPPFMVLPIFAAVERSDFGPPPTSARAVGRRSARSSCRSSGQASSRGASSSSCPRSGRSSRPTSSGARTFMIGSLMDEQIKGSQGNWPFGAAVAVILMALALLALLLYARSVRRERAR